MDGSIGDGSEIRLPAIDKRTVIGVSVAIAGNVLISLALNLQKLSHRRRDLAAAHAEVQKQQDGVDTTRLLNPPMERVRELSYEDREEDPDDIAEGELDTIRSPRLGALEPESEPLLPRVSSHGSTGRIKTKQRASLFRAFFPKSPHPRRQPFPMPATPRRQTSIRPQSMSRSSSNNTTSSSVASNGNESDYLKSKLWWTGFLLMNVGELGNFISYAFAPASVVAPLGTSALIANCFFAPLLLKERFRRIEFLGIFISILGAVTVVFSANTSDTRLDRDALIEAITQKPFIVYSITYIIGVFILTGLSASKRGRDWVFVDVGLCALFGGFTVLSTKALSTLLTMEWIKIFTEWITYPIIAILLGTGIGQIRYLNRALMRFDSKVVVPAQFVFFNLSAILGSAILYGDFKEATFHQLVTFFYGCATTFGGVYLIARSTGSQDEESAISDPESATAPSTPDVRLGTVGRRSRHLPMLDTARPSPSLRRKPSTSSLVGFSPAQRLLIMHSPVDDDDVQSGTDTRRWTMNWPVDETPDRYRTPRRSPLVQDTQLPPQRPRRDGEELDNLFSPY